MLQLLLASAFLAGQSSVDDSAVGVWREVSRDNKPVGNPITWTIDKDTVKWSMNGKVVCEYRIENRDRGGVKRLALYHVLPEDVVIPGLEPLRVIYRRQRNTLEVCYSVSALWPLDFKTDQQRGVYLIRLQPANIKDGER